MNKGRLEAFSDGVLAIIITIMVLELKVPHETDFNALKQLLPVLLSYVLSFVYIGIYWNNHHHLLHTVDSRLAKAIGKDLKGKLSIILNLIAVPSAFLSQLIAGGIYVFAALMWLVPDKRIEKTLWNKEE
jgi:uncharacterized membrane protein